MKPTIPPLTGELWQQGLREPELLDPYIDPAHPKPAGINASGALTLEATRQLFCDWDRLDDQYRRLQARIKGGE